MAKGTYYLHLEQLQTIIQQVCFIDNEDEAATMLDFYHNLGVIVKHHSTVVLRTQWLIDLFRQLITIRPYNEMVRKITKCIHFSLVLVRTEQILTLTCLISFDPYLLVSDVPG